ncbi:MAG: hypothetical protein KGL10_05800 [Alphaproteobacteria bacterium]|nr:hypothetical protein [Alphaproteobacteria bacterium]MDE2336807.1 hypothetical protein [Alphaproteobacteria bacterium]
MGSVTAANSVSIQQLSTQTTALLSIIKQNAQSEQSLANMMQQSAAPSNGRGQIVDITA